jgi:predicted PurR-regulated permease PerM
MKNISSTNPIPFFIKYFIFLASTVLTCYVLVISTPILNSLLPACILALLLSPFCTRLERLKIPRSLSTILAILLVLVILAALSFFFSSQVGAITSNMESLVDTFISLFDKLQLWTAQKLGIQPQEQIAYFKSSLMALMKDSTAFFSSTVSATAGFFTTLVLFIFALFFFLYYRSFLVSFLFQLFRQENHDRVADIFTKIQKVVKKYILGLFLVILTMATLNIIGLLIIGIKHAVFFGVLAALLTIIPYVGILIGSTLPILFALATTNSLWYPIGVLIVFVIVQFLEGNFITPNIIGTQVSINPFAAILGLFIGGLLFGVIGVVFALPILAILKVVCDEIDSLKPIGFVLGNPPGRKEARLQKKLLKLWKKKK